MSITSGEQNPARTIATRSSPAARGAGAGVSELELDYPSGPYPDCRHGGVEDRRAGYA